MNTLKAGLVIFGLVIGSTTMAQEKEGRKSPQERAQSKTDWMAKELSLTEEQKAKVATLNLQAAEQNQSLHKNTALSEEQKREAFRNNRKEQKEKLKTILTAEQLVALKAKREEFHGKHKDGSKVRGERMAKSPQERAQFRTDKMEKELSLTAEQKSKVAALNLISTEKEDAIRKDATKTPEQKKEAMKLLFNEQKGMYKDILTKEQLAILKSKKDEFRKNHPKCEKSKEGKPHRSKK